jgi:ParB-like chromosome segregation protein Spo0J
MLPIAEVKPRERNPRKHPPEQIESLAKSIREFGFTAPVLIEADGTLIAGHGRVEAAKKAGLERVPCLRVGHLTPAQVRAYVIADNKLALNAGWDDEMLRAEIEGLKDEGFDVDQIGFSDKEIAKLLAIGGSDSPDNTGIEYQEKYAVLVECDDETHQQATFEKLQSMGLACKVLVN